MLDYRMAEIAQTRPRITPIQWVICIVAAIGFAFDIYALLVLPLIVRPALMELGKLKPGTPEFNTWVGLLFYVPAMAGGIERLYDAVPADPQHPGATILHFRQSQCRYQQRNARP